MGSAPNRQHSKDPGTLANYKNVTQVYATDFERCGPYPLKGKKSFPVQALHQLIIRYPIIGQILYDLLL